MKLWVILGLFIATLPGIGQEQTLQLNHFLENAKRVRESNVDSALYYYEQAHLLSTKISSPQQRARIGYLYSYYLIASNSFDDALDVLAFNVANKNEISYEELGNTYYNLGSLYFLKEQYDEAIASFMEAENYFALAQNPNWLARSRLQLSVIYARLGNEKMETYFADASLSVQDSTNSKKHYPEKKSGNIAFLKKQLEPSANNYPDNIRSHLLYDLGLAYYANEQYSESIEQFEASLALKQKIGYSNLIPETKTNIAGAYIKLNKPEMALQLLQNLQANYKRKQPLRVESLLTEAYKEIGDYKMALFHNENLSRLQDSLNKLDESERIAEITIKYDTGRKEEQILELQKENQFAIAQLNKEKNRWMLWVGFAILLLLITLWMARRWSRSQKTIVKVQKEKEVIQKKVEAQHLLLKNKRKVYLEELQFVKSDGNYVEFHLLERKTLDRNKLKTILSQLPPNFVRVHRSYIVNKNEIESFTSSSIFLKSGEEIPLSRTFKSNLE